MKTSYPNEYLYPEVQSNNHYRCFLIAFEVWSWGGWELSSQSIQFLQWHSLLLNCCIVWQQRWCLSSHHACPRATAANLASKTADDWFSRFYWGRAHAASRHSFASSVCYGILLQPASQAGRGRAAWRDREGGGQHLWPTIVRLQSHARPSSVLHQLKRRSEWQVSACVGLKAVSNGVWQTCFPWNCFWNSLVYCLI